MACRRGWLHHPWRRLGRGPGRTGGYLARPGPGHRTPAPHRPRRAPGRADPHPAELECLPDTPEAKAWLTSLTFSFKESLFKALYPLVRRRFYFEHAELLDWTPAGTARLRLLEDLGPDWPAGSLLEGQFACEGERLLTLVAIPA
ncbi:4'-phosphopantetheinyl transferase superfamily protein [Azotobacter sp. CWF10]